MKKLQLFGLLGLLVIGLAAAPAGAFTFETGNNKAKLADWSSFYSGQTGDPLPISETVQPAFTYGDLDQTIFTITNIFQPPGELPANQYYSGSNPQLIGMLYGLQVGGFVITIDPNTNAILTTDVQLISDDRYTSLGYTGGRMDLWQSPTNSLDPSDPALWGYGSPSGVDPFAPGNYDTYPSVTDGSNTPLLSGTLQPNGDGLVSDPNSPFYNDPNHPVLLTINLNVLTATNPGTGSTTSGYIDLLYNVMPYIFNTKTDPAGFPYQITFVNRFTFYPNPEISNYESVDEPFDDPTTDAIYWNVSSQDPVTFSGSIIPEPATMSLLGMALVGLGGLVRKRKS